MCFFEIAPFIFPIWTFFPAIIAGVRALIYPNGITGSLNCSLLCPTGDHQITGIHPDMKNSSRIFNRRNLKIPITALHQIIFVFSGDLTASNSKKLAGRAEILSKIKYGIIKQNYSRPIQDLPDFPEEFCIAVIRQFPCGSTGCKFPDECFAGELFPFAGRPGRLRSEHSKGVWFTAPYRSAEKTQSPADLPGICRFIQKKIFPKCKIR